MTLQQKCPICEGHGNVPGGFYNALPNSPWSSTNVSETCRNCAGSGVVYVYQGNQIINEGVQEEK